LGAGYTVSRAVEIAAAGTGTQEAILGGTGAGVSTFTREIYLGRSAVTLAAGAGNETQFYGDWLDGAGGSSPATAFNVGTADAAGTVVLGGFVPESIPAVNVRHGTLQLGYAGGETLGFATQVTVGSGLGSATLDLAAAEQSLASLRFSGSAGTVVGGGAGGLLRMFNDGAAAAVAVLDGTGHALQSAVALDDATTFNVAAGGRLGVSGTISGGAGVGLTKTGLGRLDLAAANTYLGDTVVSEGVLAVNGSLAGGALNVAQGGTLMGSGVINGLATIAGIHSPGNSPGLETFTAGLSYASTGSLVWELSANTDSAGSRGVLYDGIDLTGGPLTIDPAATMSLVFDQPLQDSTASTVDWDDAFWGSNQSWTVIDLSGSSSWNGSLFGTISWGNDSTGASLVSKRPNASFAVSQTGGDLVLTYLAVPEPSTLALAGVGLAASAWLLRRRRGG
jgi:autotransporter-associated beta strand protein